MEEPVERRGTMQKILIVEDDHELSGAICYALEKQEYLAEAAFTIREAQEIFEKEPILLALLDVNLPDGEGFELCRWIKAQREVPVLFLTARDLEEDVLSGYDMGADDYVEKPYNPAELTARIKAHLRRYHVWGEEKPKADEDRIINGGLVLDKKQRIVIVEGEEVRLTATEYKIFELLMEHPGQIFPAEQIYEKVWNEQADYAVENTVMVHIRHIREKVEIDSKRPRYVKVVWGIGYKMEKYS